MDRGPLFENWVFTEINKLLPYQSNLKFWRSKSNAEVDFIIEHTGQLYALEVKSEKLKSPKTSRSIHSFLQAYSVSQMAVVNLSLETTVELNDTPVDFITPPFPSPMAGTGFQSINHFPWLSCKSPLTQVCS